MMDQMVGQELGIRREQEAQEMAVADARLAEQLERYEEDFQLQEDADIASLEALDAARAQTYDDWSLWDAKHGGTGEEARSVKRQRMVMHMAIQGDLTLRTKFGIPVTAGAGDDGFNLDPPF